MREIKFRAWDKKGNNMVFPLFPKHIQYAEDYTGFASGRIDDGVFEDSFEIMQYTGLKDKNGVAEIYEGDIIDVEGIIKGNIYESPQIYKKGIDCLIEGMGTEKWRNTESVAMGLGCKYAK